MSKKVKWHVCDKKKCFDSNRYRCPYYDLAALFHSLHDVADYLGPLIEERFRAIDPDE